MLWSYCAFQCTKPLVENLCRHPRRFQTSMCDREIVNIQTVETARFVCFADHQWLQLVGAVIVQASNNVRRNLLSLVPTQFSPTNSNVSTGFARKKRPVSSGLYWTIPRKLYSSFLFLGILASSSFSFFVGADRSSTDVVSKERNAGFSATKHLLPFNHRCFASSLRHTATTFWDVPHRFTDALTKYKNIVKVLDFELTVDMVEDGVNHTLINHAFFSPITLYSYRTHTNMKAMMKKKKQLLFL